MYTYVVLFLLNSLLSVDTVAPITYSSGIIGLTEGIG